MSEELVPFIDSKYKTSALPKDRAITGISAVGHISLLTALLNPEIFSMGAGQSSKISKRLLDATNLIKLNKSKYANHKLYFDVGRFDLQNSTSTLNNFCLLKSVVSKKEIRKRT